jgi:hypothetical protein
MKFIYLFCSLLFVRIIEAFRPIIARYKVFSEKAYGLIKSLSNNFLSKNNKLLENMHIQSAIPTNCDINTKICEENIILPGYMEHDPKNEVIRKVN